MAWTFALVKPSSLFSKINLSLVSVIVSCGLSSDPVNLV